MDEPLCESKLYMEFWSAANQTNKAQKVAQLKSTVEKMRPANRDTFLYVILFCNKFVKREPQNKMTTVNMALMFAPNIFRRRKGDEEEVTIQTIAKMQLHISNMVCLFENYEEVFE